MAKKPKDEWFYLSLGHRRGPVTKAEIEELIVAQDLYVDSTKVWREGMEQWVKLVESKDFAGVIKKLRTEARQADVRVRNTSQGMDVDVEVLCRGVTRPLFNVFFYGGWLIPLFIGVFILHELQVMQALPREAVENNAVLAFSPWVLVAIAFWQMAASRMKNAGYTKNLGLTIFAPVMNLWTLVMSLCAPRNYGREKKWGWGGLGFFAFLCVVLSLVFLGVIPGVKPKDAMPWEIHDRVTIFYQDATDFTQRYDTKRQIKQQKAAQKAQQEQFKKQRQQDANRAVREQRGL